MSMQCNFSRPRTQSCLVTFVPLNGNPWRRCIFNETFLAVNIRRRFAWLLAIPTDSVAMIILCTNYTRRLWLWLQQNLCEGVIQGKHWKIDRGKLVLGNQTSQKEHSVQDSRKDEEEETEVLDCSLVLKYEKKSIRLCNTSLPVFPLLSTNNKSAMNSFLTSSYRSF